MDGSKFWCFHWFSANSLLCVILRYIVYVFMYINISNALSIYSFLAMSRRWKWLQERKLSLISISWLFVNYGIRYCHNIWKQSDRWEKLWSSQTKAKVSSCFVQTKLQLWPLIKNTCQLFIYPTKNINQKITKFWFSNSLSVPKIKRFKKKIF